MSKEKKTPKLSEKVKKRDADKFCMPMEGLIIKDPNGNVIKLEANDTPFLVGHSGMEMDENMAKEKGKSITDRWESEKFKPTGRKLNKEQLEEMVKNKKYPKRKNQ